MDEKMRMPLDTDRIYGYNVQAIGVWRSLVSRLVRVQEAAGSNPATPTKYTEGPFWDPLCLYGCLGFEPT